MFYHLEERQISGWDAVEVDSRIDPWIVEMSHFETCLFVWNERRVDEFLFAVFTAVKASTEQCDAHDAEHQPEDETDEQNVANGRYCLNESVHDHLPAI